MGHYHGPIKKHNRKLTRYSIDYILAFCERLRIIKENENWKYEKEAINKEYVTFTMLMGIYNILINEGYPKKYLDNYFFFDDEPNKNKEWTKEACKFYLSGDPGYNKYIEEKKIEDFFYKTIRGRKLRKEIDSLSGNFNQ